MAKICPFLESKADIFSCYLPVSDINLAIEKSIWHSLHCPQWCALPVCIFGWNYIWDHISLFLFSFLLTYGFRTTFRTDLGVNAKTICCHNNFHLRNSCSPTKGKALGSPASEVACPLLVQLPIRTVWRIIYQFISITIYDMLNGRRRER